MSNLRDKLIKLANDNPDGIRVHLVPLLKTALMEQDMERLTPEEWMGFAIMLGYKSYARPHEAERIGVDLEKVKKKLLKIGLMKGNRLVPKAREIWKKYHPHTLPSQLHQVAPKVHYKK